MPTDSLRPPSPTTLPLALNNQIPYEQTKAINQWRSIGKSPFSDECLVQLTSDERYDDSGNLLIADETRGVYLDCTYEEDIAMASAQRRYCDCLGASKVDFQASSPLRYPGFLSEPWYCSMAKRAWNLTPCGIAPFSEILTSLVFAREKVFQTPNTKRALSSRVSGEEKV